MKAFFRPYLQFVPNGSFLMLATWLPRSRTPTIELHRHNHCVLSPWDVYRPLSIPQVNVFRAQTPSRSTRSSIGIYSVVSATISKTDSTGVRGLPLKTIRPLASQIPSHFNVKRRKAGCVFLVTVNRECVFRIEG